MTQLKDTHIQGVHGMDPNGENLRLSILKVYIFINQDPQYIETLLSTLLQSMKSNDFVKDPNNLKYWIHIINKY